MKLEKKSKLSIQSNFYNVCFYLKSLTGDKSGWDPTSHLVCNEAVYEMSIQLSTLLPYNIALALDFSFTIISPKEANNALLFILAKMYLNVEWVKGIRSPNRAISVVAQSKISKVAFCR